MKFTAVFSTAPLFLLLTLVDCVFGQGQFLFSSGGGGGRNNFNAQQLFDVPDLFSAPVFGASNHNKKMAAGNFNSGGSSMFQQQAPNQRYFGASSSGFIPFGRMTKSAPNAATFPQQMPMQQQPAFNNNFANNRPLPFIGQNNNNRQQNGGNRKFDFGAIFQSFQSPTPPQPFWVNQNQQQGPLPSLYKQPGFIPNLIDKSNLPNPPMRQLAFMPDNFILAPTSNFDVQQQQLRPIHPPVVPLSQSNVTPSPVVAFQQRLGFNPQRQLNLLPQNQAPPQPNIPSWAEPVNDLPVQQAAAQPPQQHLTKSAKQSFAFDTSKQQEDNEAASQVINDPLGTPPPPSQENPVENFPFGVNGDRGADGFQDFYMGAPIQQQGELPSNGQGLPIVEVTPDGTPVNWGLDELTPISGTDGPLPSIFKKSSQLARNAAVQVDGVPSHSQQMVVADSLPTPLAINQPASKNMPTQVSPQVLPTIVQSAGPLMKTIQDHSTHQNQQQQQQQSPLMAPQVGFFPPPGSQGVPTFQQLPVFPGNYQQLPDFNYMKDEFNPINIPMGEWFPPLNFFDFNSNNNNNGANQMNPNNTP